MQTAKQQRRMTAPASSLQPPEGGSQHTGRPPSPLRNGYLPNTFTGVDPDFEGSDDEDDDRAEWTRSPSPTSSVSQMAANFARSVTSLVNNMTPRTPGAMLTDAELEAEAERERDRSRREAERILTREAEDRRLVEERVLAMMESTKSLPPPPSRSQSLDPPSPSSSQKEAGEQADADKDLTPAQQVIQETKAREKEKKNSKGKEKEKEWPANGQAKYANPSLTSLVPPPQRRPVPGSSSPTTPTQREKEVPPLYAHFDETTGTLDVHLEKWTVGHVRALEERMGDVERWLVDKENEKEAQQQAPHQPASHNHEDGTGEPVSALGREMAKLATTPSNLSQSTQAQYPAEISAGPLTPSSSFAIPSATSPRSAGYTARESTSPPMASSTNSSHRLPRPSGDYATPPDSKLLSQDVFTTSPSSSVSGLPGTGTTNLAGSASASYSSASFSSASSMSSGLPLKGMTFPPHSVPRPGSGRERQPTPRKRYTVALGGAESDSESGLELGTAKFSRPDNDNEESEEFGGETIGKSAAAKLAQSRNATLPAPKEPRSRAQSAYGLSSIVQASPNTAASLGRRPSPLPHGRSRSIDRFGTSAGNFVDPLVLRKQSGGGGKETGTGKVAGNGKVPIGQLVAFFDGERK
ncbi:hypothetical protein B0H12DRAFT_1085725 [Mycena haematopus]|nr:hypothetical protein B0H12DRAFT_1085725 [Mycena haematopus]